MTVTNYSITLPNGTTGEYVQITNPDGGFTSMLKADYEATLAANSAPTA